MLTVIVGVVADYISNLEVNLKTITYEDILEQEKQEHVKGGPRGRRGDQVPG